MSCPRPQGNTNVPRKPILEVTPKQAEVFELILNHVKEFGYQPTLAELSKLLKIETPAVRERVAQLVSKGLLGAAPPKGERCVRFKGLKFVAYEVDDEGKPLDGQEIALGDFVITVRRKAGGKS